jgi:hypothetical protein
LNLYDLYVGPTDQMVNFKKRCTRDKKECMCIMSLWHFII